MSTLFSVGPSKLWPKIDHHLSTFLKSDLGSISHRTAAFRSMYQETDSALRKLLLIPDNYSIYFLSSASEIFERVVFNMADDHSFHFVSGAFAKKFYDYAKSSGLNAMEISIAYGTNFDLSHAQHIHTKPQLIGVTHNETSTGTKLPKNWIAQLKKENPDSTVAVDIVSSAPVLDFDIADADTVFFSVQKAFGMPAGLGVWIVNNNLLLEKNKTKRQSVHNNLSILEKNYKLWETASTPNILGIYLLGKVAQDMLDFGLENIKNAGLEKINLMDHFVNQSSTFSYFVKEKTDRSSTIIVLNVNGGNENLLAFLKTKNISVSKGYAENKNTQIRISNFPANTIEDFDVLIEALKAYENSIV